jgi:hypothetical protein
MAPRPYLERLDDLGLLLGNALAVMHQPATGKPSDSSVGRSKADCNNCYWGSITSSVIMMATNNAVDVITATTDINTPMAVPTFCVMPLMISLLPGYMHAVGLVERSAIDL